MLRYLPGAILAVFGVVAYVIGCVVFLQHRRQKAGGANNRTLFIYAMAMMLLGILAFGAGLYTLEMTQIHTYGG